MNLKATLSYTGTRYHGWQTQPNAITVQQTIEITLETITGKKIRVAASGRTDTGVHALGQVMNFFTDEDTDPPSLAAELNRLLPHDIRILSIEKVRDCFHARTSARNKLYRYTILNHTLPYTFRGTRTLVYPRLLNPDLMRIAARHLLGRHDFAAFSVNPGSTLSNTTRTISRIDITRDGFYILIDVEADGFLHRMVRSIVGTLILAGRNKIKPDHLKTIILSCDRKNAGPSAPAHGLCLIRVNY